MVSTRSASKKRHAVKVEQDPDDASDLMRTKQIRYLKQNLVENRDLDSARSQIQSVRRKSEVLARQQRFHEEQIQSVRRKSEVLAKQQGLHEEKIQWHERAAALSAMRQRYYTGLAAKLQTLSEHYMETIDAEYMIGGSETESMNQVPEVMRRVTRSVKKRNLD